jgi:hypothetical protein
VDCCLIAPFFRGVVVFNLLLLVIAHDCVPGKCSEHFRTVQNKTKEFRTNLSLSLQFIYVPNKSFMFRTISLFSEQTTFVPNFSIPFRTFVGFHSWSLFVLNTSFFFRTYSFCSEHSVSPAMLHDDRTRLPLLPFRCRLNTPNIAAGVLFYF